VICIACQAKTSAFAGGRQRSRPILITFGALSCHRKESVVLVPKLVTTLRTYSRDQFRSDLAAGVIVGIVALPLAIAFAIASGVTPERGLFTAIIAGALISALGGSRVQIGGPTGAFVVIVYSIVQQHGYAGLAVATMMAGAMLLALGLARFGGAIKFIPYPVTIGFTSGIALIIFSSQIKDFFGLTMGAVPAEFIPKWRDYAAHAATFTPWAVAVAGATLLILLVWPRVSRKVPAPFVALVVVTAVVRLFGIEVETIAGRFGEIRAGLPVPQLPFAAGGLTWSALAGLIQPAVAIALLGAIESLLSAVVADGMIGGRHRSNMELVAQGVANLASPIFGGIPATGAIARTATNVKNGGRTPVAGIVHAITLLLITLFFGRWAGYIPMAALAAILIVVAYHMSEWHTFVAELSAPRSDVAVMLATFGLTVLVDLTIALEVGMVAAAFLFMKRMAEVTNVSAVTREMEEDEGDLYATDLNAARRRTIPDGVVVYEINGPFFFGAAETFRDTVGVIGSQPKVLIIRMRNVPAMDSTGMHALRDLYQRSRSGGTLLLLSDVHAQPLLALGRSYLLDEIGERNIFGNLDDALNRARAELGLAAEPRPAGATPTVVRESLGAP
jgi:SulP family sulfate permease